MMIRYDQKTLLILLLPLFPLLDFFLFACLPVLTMASYIYIGILFDSRCVKCDGIIFIFELIVIFSIIFNGLQNHFSIGALKYALSMITMVIVASTIGKRLAYYAESLTKMVYVYFILNSTIYIYRLFYYDFDFNRVRSGVSIFGGNSVHFIYLMMLLILKKYGKSKKEYYAILLIAITNAIMFVSKGAILLTIMWIFLDIINYKKTKIFNLKIILSLILVFTVFFTLCETKKSIFLDYTINRFVIWLNLYKNTGSFMGTRGKIAIFTIEYIKENPRILFCGNGPTTFEGINPWGYFNTHNLILDILFDFGILGLLLFVLVCYIIFRYNNNRIYFLLCVFYAILEGVALFFIDSTSSIVGGFAFLFIIILYYDSKFYKLLKTKLK